MNKTRSVSVVCFVVSLMVVVLSAPGWAQTTTTVSPLSAGGVKVFTQINPPPCDFSDLFYQENGVDPTRLAGRFGSARQTGPPATGSQMNWVPDPNCSTDDPTRRDFRILATTGAFKDSNGGATEFFSLIAFLVNQTNFETSFSRTVGANTISIVNSLNPRGIAAQTLVGNFEAYGAPKQMLTSGPFAGTLAPAPCGSLFNTVPSVPAVAAADCFSVGTVPFNGGTIFAVETPNLRHDWRISSNRTSLDGSNGNCINSDTAVCSSIHDSPFGYFCDDLLGMWIVTYFWYTQFAVGGTDTTGHAITPTPNCKKVLNAFASVNGTSLDGTPVVKTGDQLHFLEGVPGTPASVIGGGLKDSDLPPPGFPCGAEGNLNPGGTDGGAVWLVCPDLQDPRNGAIAQDAFLDVVRLANGNAQNTDLLNNFSCLQNTGKFCNEAAPGN